MSATVSYRTVLFQDKQVYFLANTHNCFNLREMGMGLRLFPDKTAIGCNHDPVLANWRCGSAGIRMFPPWHLSRAFLLSPKMPCITTPNVNSIASEVARDIYGCCSYADIQYMLRLLGICCLFIIP